MESVSTCHRIARVNDTLPKIKSYQTDKIDLAIDKFAFSAKTLLLTFIGTVTIMLMIWGTWNLKNYLKIDLMSGPHHEMIDNINHSLSI